MRLRPGEVEATGWRVEPLADVVQRLLDAAPGVAGRPHVIAIDGRGGAGKTMLVHRLRSVGLNSAVVHVDDIAWYHAFFDWGDLLVGNVLEPLHRGEPVVYAPAAWAARGRPGAIRIPAGCDVVWIEGTGIIRREFRPWFDASLYLQGDLDEQQRRLVRRDGDSPEQRRHVAAWLAEELPLMRREQPWVNATLIVAGPATIDHDPRTELVVAPPVPGS